MGTTCLALTSTAQWGSAELLGLGHTETEAPSGTGVQQART